MRHHLQVCLRTQALRAYSGVRCTGRYGINSIAYQCVLFRTETLPTLPSERLAHLYRAHARYRSLARLGRKEVTARRLQMINDFYVSLARNDAVL